MISRKGYRWLRVLRIVVSVALMVVMAVTVAAERHTFLQDWQLVPAVLAAAGEWIILWAAVTALCGRVYCSTACPLGTLQDFLIRLRRRPNGFFYAPPRPRLRWLFVVVIIVAAVLGLWRLVAALSPSAGFERIVAMCSSPWTHAVAFTIGSFAAAALTLLVVAVAAVWRGRLLCNTVCPVGTVLGAFSRFSLFQMDINTDRCTGCGLCTAKCKAQCIDPRIHTVDFSRCVMCLDCVASCPNDAITMTSNRHQLQWPLLQDVKASPTAIDNGQLTVDN